MSAFYLKYFRTFDDKEDKLFVFLTEKWVIQILGTQSWNLSGKANNRSLKKYLKPLK